VEQKSDGPVTIADKRS